MAKSRFTSFKDKIVFNSTQQRNKAANYGHLSIPRGFTVFKEEPGSRISIDIMSYVVTDPNHPDKDETTGSAEKGGLWYRRPYKLHRNVGADKSSVVCPTSIGKKCPICEYRSKLLSDGVDWKDDAVKNARPSSRSLYLIIPKDNKKFEEKPHLWDISDFLFQAKLNNEIEENPDELGDFPHPANGLTLKIRFSEEKLGGNTFAETSRIDFEQRGYAYDDATIDALPSLDEVVTIKDYKEIQKMFLEGGDDDEPEEEKPVIQVTRISARTAPARTTPIRTVVVPIEEETEEEPEEEPEEPEEETRTPSVYRRPTPVAKPAEKPAAKPLTRGAPPPAARPAKVAAPAEAGTCPHGFVFGEECDKHDQCEDCPVWTDCYNASGKAA
jgi:hypothetical protein